MRAEERVAALHMKMDARRRAKERRKTGAIGAAASALAACLFLLVFSGGRAHSGGIAGMYSGATMLFEDAGGYVLLALGAFMAGVIVTAVLQRHRKKGQDGTSQDTAADEDVQRRER